MFKFLFKFIFNTIFFFISIKNYLKILNGKNINNFYLPNISIKNIIFINPSKIKYKGTTHIKFKKRSTPFIFDFDWDKKNQDLLNFEKQHHTYISCKELLLKILNLKIVKNIFFLKNKFRSLGNLKAVKQRVILFYI